MKTPFPAIIVVEGATDRALIETFLDCDIVTTNGSDVPHETIEQIKSLQEIKARLSVIEEEARTKMKEFLAENNLPEYTQDGITFTSVPGYTKKSVDTNKMKEEGVYELYTKEVAVKPSIRISIEYEDE